MFQKKVRAICLKFLLIFSQGENKKGVVNLWENDSFTDKTFRD